MTRALQSLLHRPWARALAILGVYLLGVQSARLPLFFAAAEAASCCCASRDAHCQCRACTHARELESGACTLGSCAPSDAPALAVVALDSALPPATLAAAPLAPAAARVAPPPLLHAAPPREVPTPPPLPEALS